MTFVSTIITSYNRPRLIRGAIQSILDQTIQDFEIFIMDDGSKQETRDVINQYVSQDSRIKAFFSPEPNNFEERKHDASIRYSIQINKALDLVSGKYISYLCDDDYYFPERFERLCGYMEDHPEAHVVFGKMRSRLFGSDNPDPYVGGLTDLPPDDIVEFRRDIESNPAYFKEGPDSQNVYHLDHNMVMHKKDCFNYILKPYWPEQIEGQIPVGDQLFFRKLAGSGFIFYGVDCWCCVKRFHCINNRYEIEILR